MKKLGKKKLIIVAVVLLALLGVGFKMSSPAPKVVLKVNGILYQMPKSFLINLSGGQYAKLNVTLQLEPGQSDKAEGAAASSSSGSEEAGTLPEEAIIRTIVTNVITGQHGEVLIEEHGRQMIAKKILEQIGKQTDVKVHAVLFPDLAVQ